MAGTITPVGHIGVAGKVRCIMASSCVSAGLPSGDPAGCSPGVGQGVGDRNTNGLLGRERFDDHKAGVPSIASYGVWSAIQRLADCLRPGSVAREILRECYNLPRRTQALRESKLCLYGIRIGRLQGNHVDRLGNERTRVCT
jgi:hypothetical protein